MLIESQMTLRSTAVRAFKWSLLGEIVSRLLGPVVFLVLARLLLPADFGVVAAATVVISFSQVVWDAGLARALIQRDDDDAESVNAVLWINLSLSLALSTAILWAAPAIAEFFNDPRIGPVLRVLTVQLPMAAICAVFIALMYKRFEFRQLFWVRLATTAGPGLASIPLAMIGWSYWAIVAGVLTGQALQLVVLARLARFPIRWRVNRGLAMNLLKFGKWSLASGLLGWLYGWLDAIIVGHYLGSRDMGLYRSGNTLVIAVFGLAFSPLLPVLYSLFSRAQHDLVRLRHALLTVTHAIALISLPLGVGLLAMHGDLGELLFGPQWAGIGVVIGLLGLSHGVGWIAGANGELYRAIGKPHVETFTMLAMIVVYVPTYLLSVQHGLQTFLWARVGLSVLALGLHIMVCWRVVGVTPRHWVRSCIWASSAAVLTAVLVQHLVPLSGTAASRVMVMAVVGMILYAGAMLILERDFLRYVLSLFRTGDPSRPRAGS